MDDRERIENFALLRIFGFALGQYYKKPLISCKIPLTIIFDTGSGIHATEEDFIPPQMRKVSDRRTAHRREDD
ncbi:MAG TPA: hypothetical protein DCL38_00870 [Lachnospiraceae bacterium]|nr:hypothetical protein [Lachnospiraceae bacterium]